MLLLTPWNARSVALFSWQLTHVRLATTVWLAVDSDGVVVILKPPVTKFEPWQLEQAAPASGMWVDSCVASAGTPYQAAPVPWQLLQPPLPSAMWLAAPAVPTVPGGTTTDTPYHAMPALWQLWQLSALTAVWPVEDSNGVLVSLKPVPLSVSLTAWQPAQSALLTGM